jgi:CheY-specific phosphatase CheX
MFITREDLNMSLYNEIIDAITRLDTDRERYGIRTAEAIVKSRLATRFDVGYIFGKAGDDRDAMIVDIVANIALYIIADVLEEMPVTIQNPYGRSIELLKELQEGQATLPGVPEPTNPETGEPDAYIKYGNLSNRY